MKNKAWRIASVVVLALIVTASLGVSKVLQGYTFVEWWKPAAGCALFATVASVGLRKPMHILTGMDKAALNYAAAFVCLFSIALGCFYALNFCCSDAGSKQEYSAPVVRKYSEEHYRVRRLSRHKAAKGEKYHVYCIGIALPDGRVKRIEVPVGEYAKVRKGQRVSLSIEEGFFGIPVMKGLQLPVRQYKRF